MEKKIEMEKTEKYISGRVESILNEIDSYEEEAKDNEIAARALHTMIGKGEAGESELKEFLSLEYTTHHNMQMLKNLLVELKVLKTMTDSLGIELKIEEKHKEIFDHIKKDNPYLFTFKSGKKEFISEEAEEVYKEGLKAYLSKGNLDKAEAEIKKHSGVNNK